MLTFLLVCPSPGGAEYARSRKVNQLMGQAYQYYVGFGVPVSYARALKLYLQAADLGDPEARFIAGGMLYRGQGTDPDPRRAFTLLLEAAEQGQDSPESLAIIGTMFLQGNVVPQNYIEAQKWLGLAAARNSLQGMNNLAYMLYNGLGGEQDYAEALDLYTRAAMQGDVQAQANVGLMYATGAGTEVDQARAYAWYSVAASQGNIVAMMQRNSLMAGMNWDQLNEAQALSMDLFRRIGSGKGNAGP